VSTPVPFSIAPRVDLALLRRDYFDGFSLLLQDEDGTPCDLREVEVCASVWKTTASGTTEQVVSINTEKETPFTAGRVRFWLSSAQNDQLWEAAQYGAPSGIFFPSHYVNECRPSLFWDARIEKKEAVADLVSASNGTFITQTNHGLGSSERIVFQNTAQASINYNETSARIYSGLTNLSYQPPFSFTVPLLSGVTDSAIAGSVYRLKQDTVIGGLVTVGTTFSNCFSYDYATFLRPLAFDFTKPLTIRLVNGIDVPNQRFLFLIL